MLIFKKVDEKTAGKPFILTVMGQNISLTIRPMSMAIIETLKKNNPDTDDISDALIDHVLESFSGIGDENGPLAVTLENKKMVMEIPGMDGGPSVEKFVFNAAKKLAFDIAEAETKNS